MINNEPHFNYDDDMATFLTPSNEIFTPDQKDYSEVARYLGYRRSGPPDAQVQSLIEKACSELLPLIKPQSVFEKFDLTIKGAVGPALSRGQKADEAPEILFSDVKIKSVDLARNLENCNKVYLLAATIGPQVDALIRRANAMDPAYAAVLQSTGAMYIEKMVDFTNEEIKKDALAGGAKTKPRYSPGYGDVSLQVQKDFFRLLPCTRIGLTLMETLIMAPEKSVTAFVGSLI